MKIGIPKEIKNNEFRVGMTPSAVRELCTYSHEIFVENNAGIGSGFSNNDYEKVGANIVESASSVFDQAELIVKVKEPLEMERAMLNPKHTLFTYLHLASDPAQTTDLLASGSTCIAYETVTSADNNLPLLAPMSEVAGKMSIQAGANCLEKINGGRGVLLGGVPGVLPADVVIIGGGVVGYNAAQMAIGLGANVTILDNSLSSLRRLQGIFGSRVNLIYSTKDSLEKCILKADLVIGAVLIPGAAAPKLVSAEQIKQMRTGAVIVDVAIDQGGCFETSKPTTHENPTYIIDEVVHYCVTNIPGAVARTSSEALNNATLPYVIQLANNGWKNALNQNKGFANGLNIYKGKSTNEAVSESLKLEYVEPRSFL